VTSLDGHYKSLEDRYPVEDHDGYAALVVPNGNATRPVHRWFHLKESFSADLFERVVGDTGLGRQQALTVLDPYAGVGTSLVSALGWGAQTGRKVRAIGIEQNPFLHLVAQVKVRAISRGVDDFAEFRLRLLRSHRRGRFTPASAPGLSTFLNTSYFHAADLAELLRLKTGIEQVEGSGDARALARVCLAACLEPVSGLRRDGRALRFESRKVRAEPVAEFERRTAEVAEDLADASPMTRGIVVHGDGRHPEQLSKDVEADLVLFSPPYPNNIDYTEVYKLENWFLGLISTTDAFREQRLRTVRSHPSVLFPPNYALSENGYRTEFTKLVGPILNAIPSGRYYHQRCRLIRGYFEDMLATLVRLQPLVAPEGRIVYVVGNSAHGQGSAGFVIAADTVIAGLAEAAGYEVDGIRVARRPARRKISSEQLRESVVFLRREA
jgi:hypothetical protein